MTWTTDSLTRLVEDDDPVPAVWDTLWDIWYPTGETIESHYGREPTTKEYERLLCNIYTEFFTEVLAGRCVTQPSLDVPSDAALIVMDAMSIREAALFVDVLDEEGYDTEVTYEYATVPSETEPFRDRVDYAALKKQYKTAHIGDPDPRLDGDERIVWCRFPDALLENIQEGKTKLSSIEEMYEKTKTALRSILNQLDPERAVIRSDHGYVRLDAGHSFEDSQQYRQRLQETFSGRFVSVGDATADDLVAENVVVDVDGYYLPVGRYTWPAGGKYNNFQHGGLSLLECITPRIEITS